MFKAMQGARFAQKLNETRGDPAVDKTVIIVISVVLAVVVIGILTGALEDVTHLVVEKLKQLFV